MARIRGQKGEGKIGLIIALVVVGLCIHSAVAYMPVVIAENEFSDHVTDKLKEVSARTMKRDDFVVSVIDKASQLGIPVAEHMIEVKEGKGEWSVKIDYTTQIAWLWGDAARDVTIEKSLMKM